MGFLLAVFKGKGLAFRLTLEVLALTGATSDESDGSYDDYSTFFLDRSVGFDIGDLVFTTFFGGSSSLYSSS